MDKGSLFNLALSYLGDRDYVAGSPSALACDAVAQHVIGLALDFHRWSFASRRVSLDFSHGEARLPADCLRVLSLGLERYELLGGVIYTTEKRQDVVLVYVSDVMMQSVVLPDSEPSFNEGVALLLASKVAPRLTSDLNVAAVLEQRAWATLERAQFKDARQVDSNDQSPSMRGAARGVHPLFCD